MDACLQAPHSPCANARMPTSPYPPRSHPPSRPISVPTSSSLLVPFPSHSLSSFVLPLLSNSLASLPSVHSLRSIAPTPHTVSRLNKNPSIEDAFEKDLNPHWNHVHHRFSFNSNSNQPQSAAAQLQPPPGPGLCCPAARGRAPQHSRRQTPKS